MNHLRDYVSKLTDEQRLQIVADYEVFEQKGVIGECPLREHARLVMEQYGADDVTITRWMRDLAYEIYRWYASIVIIGLRAAAVPTTEPGG